jgi:alkyl hydroperoxide reductase subunit AhpC
VEVLGISTDKPEKLSRFAEKELLNFTLLSDEDHQVCEQFGVWGEKTFMGKTYDGIHRISFLIDADGKVEHVFDDFKTSNHHDVVLNWLKETPDKQQNGNPVAVFMFALSRRRGWGEGISPHKIYFLPPPAHPATRGPPL